MKKQFTSILFLLLINTIVKAQTQKGNQLLGGSVSFEIGNGKSDQLDYSNSAYSYSSKNKISSFGLGPIYSYFVADQLDLGVSLGYGKAKTTYSYSVGNPNLNALPSKTSSQTVSGGIYLRKYFLYKQKVGIRTGPFIEYLKSKYTNEYLLPQSTNYNNNQSNSTLGTGLGLDFVYFPINRFGVFANLGAVRYAHTRSEYQYYTTDHTDQTDTFGLRLTSALNLSFVYKL